jgi:hypothetical protein
MSEDEGKQIRDEGKRPAASLWMKSKKERGGSDNTTRVPAPTFISPPKTPIASKRRKDAQAKALAKEEVAVASEGELPGEEGDTEEWETTIKKRRRIEEEDQRKTAVLQAERREWGRLRQEAALVVMEVSDEEEEVLVPTPREEPRRSEAGWMKAWTTTFDCLPASLSLFAMATLLPPCRGVTVEGHTRSKEILIVGYIGREDLHCVIGHLLFLAQNGRRSLTMFNTREEYRWRVEREDASLKIALILFIDPREFMVGREAAQALPDAGDPAWRVTWEEMRSGLAPHFMPILSFNSRELFDATDIFSGSKRKEGGAVEARDNRGDRAFREIERSDGPRGEGEGELETPRRRGKTVVQWERYDRKQMLRAAQWMEVKAGRSSGNQLFEGLAAAISRKYSD